MLVIPIAGSLTLVHGQGAGGAAVGRLCSIAYSGACKLHWRDGAGNVCTWLTAVGAGQTALFVYPPGLDLIIENAIGALSLYACLAVQ